jgi:hypothetical protein
MRLFAFLALTLFILGSASSAYAQPKPWYWSWWPSHWEDQNFKPYLEDAKIPHNTQWIQGQYVDSEWHPQDWIESKGSFRAVMDGFYNNDIIRKQDVTWRGMPILIVGDGFMRLSGQEKRRVTDFVDYVFQVTNTAPTGMYTIYYDRTKTLFGRGRPIGIYTTSGLLLQ